MIDKVKSECVPLFKEQWQTKLLVLLTIALFIITVILAQKYVQSLGKLWKGKIIEDAADLQDKEFSGRGMGSNETSAYDGGKIGPWPFQDIGRYQTDVNVDYNAFIVAATATAATSIASVIAYAKSKQRPNKHKPCCSLLSYHKLIILLGLIALTIAIVQWVKIHQSIQAVKNEDVKGAMRHNLYPLFRKWAKHAGWSTGDSWAYYSTFDNSAKSLAFNSANKFSDSILSIYNSGLVASIFTLIGFTATSFGIVALCKKRSIEKSPSQEVSLPSGDHSINGELAISK